MKIWVDADACPNVIKTIIFRAAERTKIVTTLVANQWIKIPPSPYIKVMKVAAGFDVADHRIIELMVAGDLVITADIPLADSAIKKAGFALNPRGELYTEENIKQRLATRNLMEELRSTQMISGGPPPLGQSERQAFANALDRFLAKHNA